MAYKKNSNIDNDVLSGRVDSEILKNHNTLTKALDYYLENDNPYGALFINGPWGSGKSYYINNYIKNKNAQNEKDILYIYVSLNGISKIDDIKNSISKKVCSFVTWFSDSKIANFGKSVGKIVAAFKGKDISGIDNIEFTWVADLIINSTKKVVMFFDDIERCRIDYKELFGYLNEFTEEPRYRVVVIGDEKELIDSIDHDNNKDIMLVSSIMLKTTQSKNPDSKDSLNSMMESIRDIRDYDIIKEKTINNTVVFRFDVNVFFDKLAKMSRYENIYEDVINNKENIIKCIYNCSCNNLRTLITFLDNLNKLYEYVDFSKINNDVKIKESLIINVLLDTIKYRNPKTVVNNIDFNVTTLPSIKEFVNYQKISDKIQKEIEELDESFYFMPQEEIPMYLLVLRGSWVELSDEEISTNIKCMIDAVSKNKMELEYSLLAINYYYTYVKAYKFEEIIGIREFEDILIKNIKASNKEIELLWPDYSVVQNEKPFLESIDRIKNNITAHNEKLYDLSEGKMLISLKNMQESEIEKIISTAFERKEFISKYEIDKVCNYIKDADNDELNMFRSLLLRIYGIGNSYDFFGSEQMYLIDLKKKLEGIKTESKTKNYIIKLLCSDLDRYQEHLKR